MTVDLRCPELVELVQDMELIEGQIGYVQGDLYGVWIDGKKPHNKPHWWYKFHEAWFTPDIRIARAQCTAVVHFYYLGDGGSISVCRLGPNGEPIELDTEGEADKCAEVACRDCKLPYQDHGLDITLSNEQWEMIHSEIAGVLCGRCVAVRASQLPGAIAIRAHIDFGE